MKYILQVLLMVFILSSCGNESKDTEDTETENETTASEDESSTNSEEGSYSDIDGFYAYVEIDRYEAPEEYEFSSYNFNDQFYYQFPNEPAFEETEKSDHITYYASEVVEGSQYIINIDDYTNTEDVEIDDGFTKFSHDAFVNLHDSEIIHHRELEYLDGVHGFYTVYTYFKNETQYTVDCAHFGFGDYIVGLLVTGTPYGESVDVVNDYIGLFHPTEAS